MFVFNAIKDNIKQSLSSARSFNGSNYMQGNEKTEFLRHLELIDLRIVPI